MMKWNGFVTVAAAAATVMVSSVAASAQGGIAEVRFGANPPLKLAAPKSMSASAYASIINEAYTNILSSNAPVGRYISPADVVVLCPPATTSVLSGVAPAVSTTIGKGGKSATPLPTEANLSPKGTYIIYVMGRRFLTIDPDTAAANGQTSSAALATKLARQYMQRFPRECFRPPTLPALTSVPANPKLNLTTNLDKCVPLDVRGRVATFGKALFNTAPVQKDGTTGPDKANVLSKKASRILGSPLDHKPEDITFVKNGKLADVKVGPTVLFTVSDLDGQANGFNNALALAKFIALRIARQIQDATPAVAPTPAPDAQPVPETQPTTPTTEPATPATPPTQ